MESTARRALSELIDSLSGAPSAEVVVPVPETSPAEPFALQPEPTAVPTEALAPAYEAVVTAPVLVEGLVPDSVPAESPAGPLHDVPRQRQPGTADAPAQTLAEPAAPEPAARTAIPPSVTVLPGAPMGSSRWRSRPARRPGGYRT